MWNLNNIRFENLFSHVNSAYTFKNGECTLIFGENHDDRATGNNGAGKTTLFEAICIALTGESLRGLNKEAFINREAETCMVELQMNNEVLKKRLRIVRRYSRGSKAVKIQIYENDELNTQLTSVAEANKYVYEQLGLSKEDLLRYFIIPQDSRYTFFTASDTEKKEILNRITNAAMINPVIDELGRRMKSCTLEKDKAAERLIMARTSVEMKKEELRKRQEEQCVEKRVEVVATDIRHHEQAIQMYQDTYIAKMQKKIEEFEEVIASAPEDDLEVIKKAYRNACKLVEKYESEESEARAYRRKAKATLEEQLTCPNCGKPFIPNSEIDLPPEEIKALVEQLDLYIPQLKKDIEKAEKQRDKIKSEITRYEEIGKARSDLAAAKRRMKQYNDYIDEEREYIKRKQEEIRKIRSNGDNDPTIIRLKDEIKAAEKKEKEMKEVLKEREAEVEMVHFWQFNMGKSGFLTYLSNRVVKLVQGVTNSFLQKFGVDISVVVNGYKILKSGDVREKIDVFITNDGITEEPFMCKSGGERSRVTLAGILGLQHLINLSTDGRGLNFLALDESLNNVDREGVVEICKTLNELGVTVMIISQNIDNLDVFQNKLFVVKNDGISSYFPQ